MSLALRSCSTLVILSMGFMRPYCLMADDERDSLSAPSFIEADQDSHSHENATDWEEVSDELETVDPFEVPLGQGEIVGTSEIGDVGQKNGHAAELESSGLNLGFGAGFARELVPFSPPIGKISRVDAYLFNFQISRPFCRTCRWPAALYLQGNVLYPTRLTREFGQSISRLQFETGIETYFIILSNTQLFRCDAFSQLSLAISQRQYTRHLLREFVPEFTIGARALFSESVGASELGDTAPIWVFSLRSDLSRFAGFYRGIEMEPLDRSDRAFESRDALTWAGRGALESLVFGVRVLRFKNIIGDASDEFSGSGPFLDIAYGEKKFRKLVQNGMLVQDQVLRSFSFLVGWTRTTL